MPNFHLHWLVAWRALDRLAPDHPARAGRDAYGGAAQVMRKRVHDAVEDLGALFSRDTLVRVIRDAREDFDARLVKTPAIADQVTCFSAFMLGACGPDFWTLPTGRGKPWTASHHFNLGHYNRTHEQFRVSVAAVGNAPGLQADVERAYFLGMATHIAADLVIHQLVNVYAGAYNLLKENVWSNQGGHLPVKIWNTHNKVEHFWDTYVRFRYLGDLTLHAPVFEGGESGEGRAQLGFPLADTLPVLARKRNWVFRSQVDAVVADEAIKVELESPLVLPMLACDRILGAWPRRAKNGPGHPPVAPFIHERVVARQGSAYPEKDLYPAANGEKEHPQMRTAGSLGEHGKLEYFSRALNTGAVGDPGFSKQSQNYFTYYVAPDLAWLRRTAKGLVFGRDAFYDLPALDRFVVVAVDRAKRFLDTLSGAYTRATPGALNELAKFWNLDTGLGLEVQHVPSHTSHEVITRLDFRHILQEEFGAAKLEYARPAEPGEPPAGSFRYLTGKQKDATSYADVQEEAFPVRPRTPPFPSLAEVQEEEDGRYLDRIRLEGRPSTRLVSQELQAFFDPTTPPPPASLDVRTKEQRERNVVKARDVRHRLTLELRVPIAHLGEAREEPAAFLYCDDALPIDRPAGADAPPPSKSATKAQRKAEEAEEEKADAAKNTHEWMHARARNPIFFAKQTADVQDRLRFFTARILVNLEKAPAEEGDRVVAAPGWNNVVPHQASVKFYGRNFAIATGRRFVLSPVKTGNFDPTTDFAYLDRVSPTEHVFLTLYPLVKTPSGEVIDAFSKEPVSQQKFQDEIRRISGLGWVKVVLLYVLGAHGALQLGRCFVDGLEVEVREGPAEAEAR